jgi:hypothetical protein
VAMAGEDVDIKQSHEPEEMPSWIAGSSPAMTKEDGAGGNTLNRTTAVLNPNPSSWHIGHNQQAGRADGRG